MRIRKRAVLSVIAWVCVVFLGYCALGGGHAYATTEFGPPVRPDGQPMIILLYSGQQGWFPYNRRVELPGGIFCGTLDAVKRFAAMSKSPESNPGRDFEWFIAEAGCRRLGLDVFTIDEKITTITGHDTNGLSWQLRIMHVEGVNIFRQGYIPF